MNASVQLITAPSSWLSNGPAQSALGLKGGGASTPILHGSGFSWGSIVGGKVGGPISYSLPNVRGIPMTATFVRRQPGGSLRGLGQDDGSMISTPLSPSDIAALSASNAAYFNGSTQPAAIFTPPTSVSPSAASVLGPLITAAGAIGQQYMSYQNPLYQKQTVALSPSGQVLYATNQPSFGTAATTAAGAFGSMLPILLVAVVAFVLIGAAKK